MFRFTRKPSSGSHSQYLAEVTHLVKSRYVEVIQDVVSVMAAYCDLWVQPLFLNLNFSLHMSISTNLIPQKY